MKGRIWELDVFRGICILGMVLVHLYYDLIEVFRLLSRGYPPIILFFLKWGSILFLILSGICVTLGRRCVHRGLVVLCSGLAVTAVTLVIYRIGFADRSILIYFGILHCLGACMMLWYLFQRLPTRLLFLLCLPCILIGLYLETATVVTHPWLLPLGLTPPHFSSADYFPLLPNLGYFLLGAVIGRSLYPGKQTLLPGVSPKTPVVRFLSFCGRHSLAIYLLHQPLLFGIFLLLGAI